jgi:hypothetical protein
VDTLTTTDAEPVALNRQKQLRVGIFLVVIVAACVGFFIWQSSGGHMSRAECQAEISAFTHTAGADTAKPAQVSAACAAYTDVLQTTTVIAPTSTTEF